MMLYGFYISIDYQINVLQRSSHVRKNYTTLEWKLETNFTPLLGCFHTYSTLCTPLLGCFHTDFPLCALLSIAIDCYQSALEQGHTRRRPKGQNK